MADFRFDDSSNQSHVSSRHARLKEVQPEVLLIGNDSRSALTIRRLLSGHQYHLTKEFRTVLNFLHESPLDQVGCIICVIQENAFDSHHLQSELISRKSPLSVVFISEHMDVPTVVKAMRLGAIGVLEENELSQKALLDVLAIGIEKSIHLDQQFSQIVEFEARLSELTPSEHHVMHGMITGSPNKAIARELQTSMRTVDRRRRSVLHKMEVASIGELACALAQHSIMLEQSGTMS